MSDGYVDNLTWSVGRLFEKWVLRQPDKPAVIFDDKAVTYKELDSAANRLGHAFKAMGLKKGDRVAGMGKNALPPVALYIAAAKMGLVAVPINNRLLGQTRPSYLAVSCTSSAVQLKTHTEIGCHNFCISRFASVPSPRMPLSFLVR